MLFGVGITVRDSKRPLYCGGNPSNDSSSPDVFFLLFSNFFSFSHVYL
jgi:hypothetical protein